MRWVSYDAPDQHDVQPLAHYINVQYYLISILVARAAEALFTGPIADGEFNRRESGRPRLVLTRRR